MPITTIPGRARGVTADHAEVPGLFYHRGAGRAEPANADFH